MRRRLIPAVIVFSLLLVAARAVRPPESIGDRDTLMYHRPSCPQVGLIPTNKALFLTGRDEAALLGFMPCPLCTPRRAEPFKNIGRMSTSRPEPVSESDGSEPGKVRMVTEEIEVPFTLPEELKVPNPASMKGREILGGCRARVPAGKPWVHTGLVVSRGHLLEIKSTGLMASGRVAGPDEPPGPWFPDGRNAAGEFSDPIESRRRFYLRGRIGKHEFRIGKGLRYTVPASGELHLGIKDTESGYADNVGEFGVLVVIRPLPRKGKKESKQAGERDSPPDHDGVSGDGPKKSATQPPKKSISSETPAPEQPRGSSDPQSAK